MVKVQNFLFIGEKLPKIESALSPNEKIAVYTSVFGDYDQVREPQYFADNIDYYFVSDKRPESLRGYQWVDAREYLPKGVNDAVMQNRFVKMHPHVLFPQYKYSVYIDGSVEIINDISMFVQKSKIGISVFLHPLRDDIYMEALAVVNYRRANKEQVACQMRTYREENMPTELGLPEMRVFAREHNNLYCINIMEAWWDEFQTKSKRDQLSFMYAVWKNGFTLSDMFVLGRDMKKHGSLKIWDHMK